MTASFRAILLLLLILGGIAWLGHAGETLKPGKLSKEEQAALQPGLALRIASKDVTDTRRVRLAALHVPAGSAPSPFLDAGPFTAKLSGYLKTALKSEFSFRLFAKGSATLRINGKDVLRADNTAKDTSEQIQLAKGYNRIEVDFTSPTAGDATLRVYWSGDNFTTEPLPPDLLFTRGDAPSCCAANNAVRAGCCTRRAAAPAVTNCRRTSRRRMSRCRN